MSKRVVITGLGVVTSLGLKKEEFWNNIKEGKCGISLVERFDTSDLPTKVAAEIKNFDPAEFMTRKESRRMDRYSQYALAASKMAFEDSKLSDDYRDNERMGVILSSGIGGLETLLDQNEIFKERGYKRISPFLVPMMIANMAAGRVAIEFGAKGFVECVVTACASSTNAIGDSFKIIQRGDADIMITGGAEATVLPLTYAGFCAANKSMSQSLDPSNACKPFDLERDGFVLGEGAAVLIMEELEHAKKRNANIIAEVAGYGCTCDAYHITAPDPQGDGARRCMEMAIKDSGVKKEDINYINAHGTGTPLNDKNETNAIKNVLGENEKNVSVSATKSMTGHLMGAAGALEGIITALSIKNDFVPPTISYTTKDPECDLTDIVANKGREKTVNVAMSNSFGFGGHNATIVMKKYK